jgi:hypothetical protein
MALTETDITRTTAQFMRDFRENFNCLSGDLKAAAVALDTYLDTNGAAINSTIPQPARGALSTQQKLYLMAYVAMRRAGKLKAEED